MSWKFLLQSHSQDSRHFDLKDSVQGFGSQSFRDKDAAWSDRKVEIDGTEVSVLGQGAFKQNVRVDSSMQLFVKAGEV